MTKKGLNHLYEKDKLTIREVEKLFSALRDVQHSFQILMNDGRLSLVDEKIIKRHFKGTVCA